MTVSHWFSTGAFRFTFVVHYAVGMHFASKLDLDR